MQRYEDMARVAGAPGDRCAIVCALTRAALPEFPTRVDGVVALERRALTRLAAANE